MRGRVLDWLPDGAFDDTAVESVLIDPVARWSEHWFARRNTVISVVLENTSLQANPAAPAFHVEGASTSAELSGPGKRHLLEAALDIDLASQTLSEKDHRVLDALASRIVEDLLARLDNLAGKENAGCEGREVGLVLSIAGSDVLIVAIPRHVLVPMLKARLGGARPARGVLGSQMDALKPTRVTAEGLLGRAELTVDDLKGLTAGDVLVLDTSLHEPVELRLTGSGRHVGAGRLVRNGGQISIQL